MYTKTLACTDDTYECKRSRRLKNQRRVRPHKQKHKHILRCAFATPRTPTQRHTYTTHEHSHRLAPISAGVITLAAGFCHTCALATGRGAYCWGSNGYGQLGTDDVADRNTPTAVTGLGTGGGWIYIAISFLFVPTCSDDGRPCSAP